MHCNSNCLIRWVLVTANVSFCLIQLTFDATWKNKVHKDRGITGIQGKTSRCIWCLLDWSYSQYTCSWYTCMISTWLIKSNYICCVFVVDCFQTVNSKCEDFCSAFLSARSAALDLCSLCFVVLKRSRSCSQTVIVRVWDYKKQLSILFCFPWNK